MSCLLCTKNECVVYAVGVMVFMRVCFSCVTANKLAFKLYSLFLALSTRPRSSCFVAPPLTATAVSETDEDKKKVTSGLCGGLESPPER